MSKLQVVSDSFIAELVQVIKLEIINGIRKDTLKAIEGIRTDILEIIEKKFEKAQVELYKNGEALYQRKTQGERTICAPDPAPHEKSYGFAEVLKDSQVDSESLWRRTNFDHIAWIRLSKNKPIFIAKIYTSLVDKQCTGFRPWVPSMDDLLAKDWVKV